MSQASKAELWKECKARCLTFEVSYQKLTREELLEAIAKHDTPLVAQPVELAGTPTEEELKIKQLRKETKATRLQVQELKALEAADKAQRSLDAILAQRALTEAALAQKARKEQEIAAVVELTTTQPVVTVMNDELLSDAKDAEIAGKSFRLANQRFFLTYKTHLVKEDVASFFGEKNVKECICAHERADESSPYEHTHVYVDFGRNYQSTNARVFDFAGIHPNIKVIRSAKHLENIWAYLCKEDKSNEHLLSRITKKTLFDTVAACKSVQDVMRMATRPNDAMGLCALYALRDREQVEIKPLSQEWQLELATELEGKPHNRKIIWYYDAVGGTGKTEFSVYMQASKLATVMSQLGGDRDSGQLIETARDNGWDGKVIIIDIPRQGEHRSIYSPLEAIKNGLVTNVKYRGGTTTYPCPHLVVMANFLPRIHEMSLDRWDVRELLTEVVDDVRRVHARPMTLDEIHRRALEQTSVAELRDELLKRASGCATKRDMLLSLIDNARHELRVLDGLATP